MPVASFLAAKWRIISQKRGNSKGMKTRKTNAPRCAYDAWNTEAAQNSIDPKSIESVGGQ
jgi:hypothetical protein